MENYVKKYGDDGKNELNSLAASHEVTLVEDTTGKTIYAGCGISGGQLRVLFKNPYLGSNIEKACADLAEAVQTAERPAGADGNGSGATQMSFHARNSIKDAYDPAIEALISRARTLLVLPSLTLNPNFESNFGALHAAGKGAPRDWEKNFGRQTIAYFDGFVKNVEQQGFGKDDMLQEGFAEAVTTNEVALRVVSKTKKPGAYIETVIEDGKCYIQSTAEYWSSNMNHAGSKLIDLL